METILVSGASGVVGYGILKSLAKYNRIGTTIYDVSVAPLFANKVEKILPTNDDYYIDNLCEIIRKHKVDVIIPSIECDMYKWNQYRGVLNAITLPLLNNQKLITLCYDKWKFYEKLIKRNPKYAIPTKITPEWEPFQPPFLLKPRHGFGSKGIVRINKLSEYDKYIERIESLELMIQPIIGSEDEEYTVSGFFDMDSHLIDYFPLKRKLAKDGFTGEAEVVDRNFGLVLSELAKTFKPIGATNFQFRLDGDTPKLLEINPRISSATSIRYSCGYNEAQMSIDYFLYGKLPELNEKPYGKRAVRYVKDFIF